MGLLDHLAEMLVWKRIWPRAEGARAKKIRVECWFHDIVMVFIDGENMQIFEVKSYTLVYTHIHPVYTRNDSGFR